MPESIVENRPSTKRISFRFLSGTPVSSKGSNEKEAMKKIPPTQNQFAIVDAHWYDYLMQWKWCAKFDKDSQSYYAVRNEGPFRHQKMIFMHRVIMNTPEGMICDHIHHNTLDNREKELRNVNKLQNNLNSKVRVDNELGIKGIDKRRCGTYRAQLRIKGKVILNKVFKNINDAIEARQEAEKKYFGEFAYQEKR